MEDVDLGRRLNREAETMHLAEAFIYHDYRKGSYKNTTNLKLHLRSAVKYFNKWGWVFDAERRKINKEVRQKNQTAKLK